MENRDYQALLVSQSGAVCTLTLNRPARRNALSAGLVNELLHALEDAHADPSVRVIVLTGAGDSFCAGGDFSQMSGEEQGLLEVKGGFPELLLALLDTTKPIVARVNGHALGGGLGLVAASTFAVAAESAQLGTPEIRVGLFPFMILAVLGRVVSRRRLTELFLSGERLSAAQGVSLGLLSQAVPAAELDAAVAHYTELVTSKSPKTIELGLRALRDSEGLRVEEQLPLLSERLMLALGTEDAQEGLRAFLEKRPPVWVGR
ncbi:MAG: enoyl-CoA hydratase/isomerase family protein [Polyangiaceae bacterium]|nr:enoyl-CoA hydratase/isomerase family protein [Polyangiaceae bacterium]MCW5790650.1 enoyl-CoA hydratase/isomerase family protein [Polyangiaceae bacterium]